LRFESQNEHTILMVGMDLWVYLNGDERGVWLAVGLECNEAGANFPPLYSALIKLFKLSLNGWFNHIVGFYPNILTFILTFYKYAIVIVLVQAIWHGNI